MTKWPRCKHNREICSDCIVPDDAAKRFADGIRLICAFSPLEERVSSWVAVKLQDGSVDYTLYPSKASAISHQTGDEQLYCYMALRNYPVGLSDRDAAIFLAFNRYAYDHGMRMSDPDHTLIMPQGRDQRLTRLITPPSFPAGRRIIR